eukprot:scaffold319740_cov15-Tisochrysis_lutea.AAC.1
MQLTRFVLASAHCAALTSTLISHSLKCVDFVISKYSTHQSWHEAPVVGARPQVHTVLLSLTSASRPHTSAAAPHGSADSKWSSWQASRQRPGAASAAAYSRGEGHGAAAEGGSWAGGGGGSGVHQHNASERAQVLGSAGSAEGGYEASGEPWGVMGSPLSVHPSKLFGVGTGSAATAANVAATGDDADLQTPRSPFPLTSARSGKSGSLPKRQGHFSAGTQDPQLPEIGHTGMGASWSRSAPVPVAGLQPASGQQKRAFATSSPRRPPHPSASTAATTHSTPRAHVNANLHPSSTTAAAAAAGAAVSAPANGFVDEEVHASRSRQGSPGRLLGGLLHRLAGA